MFVRHTSVSVASATVDMTYVYRLLSLRYPSNVSSTRLGIRCFVIAKFHYTDTDTGPTRTWTRIRTNPHGPNGVSPQKKVRVRVVEFSYYLAYFILARPAAAKHMRADVMLLYIVRFHKKLGYLPRTDRATRYVSQKLVNYTYKLYDKCTAY